MVLTKYKINKLYRQIIFIINIYFTYYMGWKVSGIDIYNDEFQRGFIICW